VFSWISDKLRVHFGFSKTEANGTLVLLLLCCFCLIVLQGVQRYYGRNTTVIHDRDLALLEQTLKTLKTRRKTSRQPTVPTPVHSTSPRDRLPSLQTFDINTADEAQLCTIRGVGPVLSARIVKFRDKLGGFVNQEQYEEVYGLTSKVIQRLKKHTYINPHFYPRLLNINTIDISTLAAHPYLTYLQARCIVRYREQHGAFSHVEVLEAFGDIDTATLEKIKPYLVVR